jgi:hypothetical protein
MLPCLGANQARGNPLTALAVQEKRAARGNPPYRLGVTPYRLNARPDRGATGTAELAPGLSGPHAGHRPDTAGPPDSPAAFPCTIGQSPPDSATIPGSAGTPSTGCPEGCPEGVRRPVRRPLVQDGARVSRPLAGHRSVRDLGSFRAPYGTQAGIRVARAYTGRYVRGRAAELRRKQGGTVPPLNRRRLGGSAPATRRSSRGTQRAYPQVDGPRRTEPTACCSAGVPPPAGQT